MNERSNELNKNNRETFLHTLSTVHIYMLEYISVGSKRSVILTFLALLSAGNIF